MEANTFLNQHQVETLKEKKWSVNPNGKYITLYKDDFSNNNAWEEVCQQLNVSIDTEYVDVLYFGVQSDN